MLLSFQAEISANVSGLLETLKDDRYAWMRLRITETWPQWKDAIKELAITQDMFNRKKRKVYLTFDNSYLFIETNVEMQLGHPSK